LRSAGGAREVAEGIADPGPCGELHPGAEGQARFPSRGEIEPGLSLLEVEVGTKRLEYRVAPEPRHGENEGSEEDLLRPQSPAVAESQESVVFIKDHEAVDAIGECPGDKRSRFLRGLGGEGKDPEGDGGKHHSSEERRAADGYRKEASIHRGLHLGK